MNAHQTGAERTDSILPEAAAVLKDAGVEAPRREARLLLAHALRMSPEQLVSRDIPVPAGAADLFRELVARRSRREPFAYITGRREFWSLAFEVGPAVLIPRPETETLIEASLREFPRREQALRVLDLGTGSGCLLLAFLSERPNATGLGVDLSPDAIEIAARNARHLSLQSRTEFVRSDWTAGIGGKFDVVFANPPYVRSSELPALEPEVAGHEPLAALDGGADGLSAYRAIASGLAPFVAPGGRVFLEAGEGQAAAVRGIFAAAGFGDAGTVPDLAGIERCVVASGLE